MQYSVVTTLLATALFNALLATAHPGHGIADNYQAIEARKSRNETTITPPGTHNATIADDYIPEFQKPCVCEPAVCPSYLSPTSICQCKQQALYACYKKSAGGCAKPEEKTCG